MAAPFDAGSLRLLGAAIPVLNDLFAGPTGATDFAVSPNGTLVHRTGSGTAMKLMSVAANGAVRALLPEMRNYRFPRVSPDGRRVAVTVFNLTMPDIWVWDRPSLTLSRLTTNGGERPEWTPDGKRIAYVANDSAENSREHIRSAPWDGSALPDTLIRREGQVEEITFGPTGTFLAVRWDPPDGLSSDVMLAPVDSPSALRSFFPGSANEGRPRISPNGKLIAYTSNESGRTEVYVRPLPGPGPRLQVSTNGGGEPVWSRDGQRVFYRAAEPVVMSATVSTAPELSVTRRDSLFADAFVRNGSRANYDVFPSGDFVFVMSQATNKLIYTANWDVALRRRFAAEQRER
jgi:Tol biopolymer transport system component